MRARCAALLLGITLTVAACGGDDDTGAPVTVPTSTTSPFTPPSTTTTTAVPTTPPFTVPTTTTGDPSATTAVDSLGLALQLGDAVALAAGLSFSAAEEDCVGRGILDAFGSDRLVEIAEGGATPTNGEIDAVQSVLSNCGIG
ncbi:MAG: hypothetical protein AB7Q42_06985 [Acidimicrobiia bacterium]